MKKKYLAPEMDVTKLVTEAKLAVSYTSSSTTDLNVSKYDDMEWEY